MKCSNPAATRDKRPTGSAIHSKVKRRRKLDPPCNKSLVTRPGPTDNASSPTHDRCQEHVFPTGSTDFPPLKTVGPASQPTMSEISEHDLDEAWDKILHPAALDSSKSLCMPRQFDSMRCLARVLPLQGPVQSLRDTDLPPQLLKLEKHYPPPPKQSYASPLFWLWSHKAGMLSHNQGDTGLPCLSPHVGFPNT
jgi:hypothetical protein